MKKIIYISLVSLLCLPIYSCLDASSLMDKEDVGDLYEKDVFTSGTYARYFVNDIYYNIITNGYDVSGWGGAYMDCATDNGEARPLTAAAHRYNTGNWNAADNPLGFIWTNSYAEIRACNKFLENCYIIEEESGITTQLDIEYMRAQVIFLRAYFYSELLRAFGGVPLITKVLTMNDPELEAPRDSFETILEFIVTECDTAAELFKNLRAEDATRYGLYGNNFGRANEGAAKALKAKVLLMAASPLFNRPSDSPQQYDSGDLNVALWRYSDYDLERWDRAAQALKEVIDLGFYDLYRAKSGTKTAYETLFCVRAPIEEAIFSYLRGPSIDIYYNNLPFDFMLVRGKGTPVCYNLPTHDLVMAYEMENGMLPEQEGSGYRPLNPFAGRDPRLNATIWHDESVFCNIRFDTWHREVTSEKSDGKHYITGYARTGYFLRKYMDPDLNPSATTAPTLPNSYHLIRYADILLMYAEALNEYSGPEGAAWSEIKWAIDQVRSRAEMPGIEETFQNRGWDVTQDNIRKFIQNERRVEFAFEEHRFWDIRRWMIGKETQLEAHEMDITLLDDDRTKIYESRKFENRVFEDKMNLMPIPQSEINKNPNLVQNWGWAPKQVN